MSASNLPAIIPPKRAWNRGRVIGQKRPLLPKHVWAIRVRLELAGELRDLALFNLAIDSKLRGCDLVRLKVSDVFASGSIKERVSVLQSKTQTPVRFEITDGTRKSLLEWISNPAMIGHEYLWPGRFHDRPHISTRQYARLLKDWVKSIGLASSAYGTHSMRRTKVAQIYKKNGKPKGLCSFCWAIQRWTAQFDIWASISKMLLPFRKVLRFEDIRSGPVSQPALTRHSQVATSRSAASAFLPFEQTAAFSMAR